MTTMSTLIGVKFAPSDRASFAELAAADRLSHINYCDKNGGLHSLTVEGALNCLKANFNVYADVAELANK